MIPAVVVGFAMMATVLTGILVSHRLPEERIKGPRPRGLFMPGPRLTARSFYRCGNYTKRGKRLLAWIVALQIAFAVEVLILLWHVGR